MVFHLLAYPRPGILPLALQGINKYLNMRKCCLKRKTIGAAEIAYGQEQALLFQRIQPVSSVHVRGSQLTVTLVPGAPALFSVYHRTTLTSTDTQRGEGVRRGMKEEKREGGERERVKEREYELKIAIKSRASLIKTKSVSLIFMFELRQLPGAVAWNGTFRQISQTPWV